MISDVFLVEKMLDEGSAQDQITEMVHKNGLFESLSSREKDALQSILGSDNVSDFDTVVTSIVNTGYRNGDFKQLWEQRKNIQIISLFCRYMDSSNPMGKTDPYDRPYIDVALGLPVVNYKQFSILPHTIVESFVQNALLAMSKNNTIHLSFDQLNYFLPFVKGVYQLRHPESHIQPLQMHAGGVVQRAQSDTAVLLSKDAVLNNALRVISNIFEKPAEACQYLKSLEQTLQSLRGGNGIEQVPVNTYEWRSHVSIYFPVPKEKFVAVKQNHLLSQALLQSLQRFDLGKVYLKLFLLVGEDTMNEVISRGYCFSESTLNHHMLLHGKATHMIQLLIVCELINSGRIRTQYNGYEHITIKDVLERLLKPLNVFQKRLAWDDILDNAREFNYKYGFKNPYILNSYLMLHGDFHGLPGLSSLMKMSFLKHFGKCRDFYALRFNANNLTSEGLWNIISMTNPAVLIPVDETDAVIHDTKNKRDELCVYRGKAHEGATTVPYFIMVKSTTNASEELLPLKGTLVKKHTAQEIKAQKTMRNQLRPLHRPEGTLRLQTA